MMIMKMSILVANGKINVGFSESNFYYVLLVFVKLIFLGRDGNT